jgi:RES domain-containing protein
MLRFVGYAEEVVRAVDSKYADHARIDPRGYVQRTLSYNAQSGGRYNAPGEFGALYTASDEPTAWAELHARMRREGLPGLPPVMGLIRLTIVSGEYVVFNDDEAQDAWDISREAIQSEEPTPEQREACWRLGRAVRVVADFLRAPSGRADGDNIPLFIGERSRGDFRYEISATDVVRATPIDLRALARESWD